jgi:hypothetical protein
LAVFSIIYDVWELDKVGYKMGTDDDILLTDDDILLTDDDLWFCLSVLLFENPYSTKVTEAIHGR